MGERRNGNCIVDRFAMSTNVLRRTSPCVVRLAHVLAASGKDDLRCWSEVTARRHEKAQDGRSPEQRLHIG